MTERQDRLPAALWWGVAAAWRRLAESADFALGVQDADGLAPPRTEVGLAYELGRAALFEGDVGQRQALVLACCGRLNLWKRDVRRAAIRRVSRPRVRVTAPSPGRPARLVGVAFRLQREVALW
ncbi:MAG: hypothetical protein WD341_06150 [Tistlia sp.]|uniref:hypothetical protein n=1 Tax=Tistlia sp. TaxID=3057121 RepID=UPI0034A2B431